MARGSALIFPSADSSGVIKLKVSPKNSQVEYSRMACYVSFPISVVAVESHNSSFFFITKDGNANYKLVEQGCLQFGKDLTVAINSFYHAVSYTPPHDKREARVQSLEESVESSESLIKLLTEIQHDCEWRFPGRKSFAGAEGAIASDTLSCLKGTVSAWKALIRRIEFLSPSSISQVKPSTVTNELLVEHSFGFTAKKGQGQNLNMEEYLHAKKRHEIDFQLRMCNVDFQQNVSVKCQDKGYQQLSSDFRSPLKQRDIFELLESINVNDTTVTDIVTTPEDLDVLRQAYLLTKSVPRRSNRSKWKEESGFAPNLLTEGVILNDNTFLSGDILFTADGRGSV